MVAKSGCIGHPKRWHECRAIDPIIRQLHDARISADMTLAELAIWAECTETSMSKNECGLWDVRLAKLRRWADALGYEVMLRRRDDQV